MQRQSTLIAVLTTTLLIVAAPVSAETISYTEAAGALVAACGADINANCKGVKPGGDRIQACLAENASKVSAQCKETYAKVFASLAERAKAQAALPQLCKYDAERYCSNFRAGDGRILRCLIRSDNVRKVSKKCNQAITNAGWR
jgi:Cysteine rich repeat